MTRELSLNDDATDKRLSLLVSLVVVAGGVAVVTALAAAWADPSRPSFLMSAAIIVAIATGSRTQWLIRVRSHKRGISWPEVGILVGLTLVSPAWVILCTCVAVAIVKLS